MIPLLFIIFIILAFFLIILKPFIKNQKTLNLILTSLRRLGLMGFILFVVVVALQTKTHFVAFEHTRNRFPFQSTHEKSSFYQGVPYHFANYCKRIYPGRHRGKFVTDLDINEPYNMRVHRIISYFLYPAIDVRMSQNKSMDCIVVYEKDEPEQAIPDDFEVLGYFSDRSLLAVRKEIPR